MLQFELDTSGAVEPLDRMDPVLHSRPGYMWDDLSPFCQGYIEALFWTNTEGSREAGTYDPENGSALPEEAGFSDLAPETLALIIADCEAFQAEAKKIIARKIGFADLETEDGDDYTTQQAGHDFWLTRCGHGAGFWDRGLPHGLGDDLTEAARRHGERWVYLGDDGKVYLS